MLIVIDPHSGVPIYRQIADQARSAILAGRLKAGEQLPSVRKLASELQVNPLTVSKAYGLLESDELVYNRRGIGLFVRNMADTDRMVGRGEAIAGDLAALAAKARSLGISGERLLEMLSRELGMDAVDWAATGGLEDDEDHRGGGGRSGHD